MKCMFVDLRYLLLGLGCGVLLLSLAACAPTPHSDLLPQYDSASRSTDPESAAMEAFARANLMSIDGDFEGSLVAIDQAIVIDPESSFLYLSKAEILLHMGELEPAQKALEQALSLNPDLLDAYLTLSEVQTVRGDHPAAIESLIAASRLQPDDQQIVLHLALAYARNRDLTSAIALLEESIKTSPDNVNPYLALARIYLVSDSPQLSVDTYRALLQIEPENEQATLELGALFTQLAQTDQAVALYLGYLEKDPASQRIRYQLVRIYLGQNLLESALEQLTLIVEHDSDDLDALHRIGLIRLQQQKPELAEQIFRDILRRNPDGANHYALGIALEEGEKWEEALSTFAQIERDAEHFPDAVIHRAYLLPKVGRRLDAITLLESELGLLEPLPELYEFLASLYVKEKALTKAEQTIAAGLVPFPDNPALLLRQAFILDQAGEIDASMISAKKVLELEPENVEALNFIAYSYAVQNINLQEAEVLVLKAIALAEAPHIRDTYGWVLYRMNRFDEALVELEKASAGIPDDPTVLEHLGDLYVVLNRYKEALSVYQKALESDRSIDPVLIQQKMDALQIDRLK